MRYRVMAALGLAAGLWCAGTVVATPAGFNDEEQRTLDHAFKTFVAPRFTVLPTDLLDVELRAAALAMQEEHLPRVRALMERWMAEEAQRPHPQRAPTRMVARLANEFALWGRDSGGAAHDAALAQALQTPGMCRRAGPQASELVMRLSRLRELPAPARRDAMQAERDLLARWGQPRAVDESDPLDAEAMLMQLRIPGQAPRTPLPAVLAEFFLGDDDSTRRAPFLLDPPVRCALHQWAGASPAQFRAAMARPAADVLWVSRREAVAAVSDAHPYPRLAASFGARGRVTIQAEVDPQGLVVSAKVVKRDVQVPGIRQARAFAYEPVLDMASLAKAREMAWHAAAPKQGLKAVEREFEWALDWE